MTTVIEGVLAEELVIVPTVSNGAVIVSKLSTPEIVNLTIADMTYSGGTATWSPNINGRNITLSTSGIAGTAYVSIKGRL